MGSDWLGDQELGMGNTVFVMRSLEGPKKGRQKGDTGSRKDIFRVRGT